MSGPVASSFRRFVRGGVEQQQLTDLNSLMNSLSLSSSKDRWVCNISGDGSFSVKAILNYLDDHFLPSASEPIRWVKSIPLKINVFAWRACLPTRANLVRRGIAMESINCPMCNSFEEDVHHVFFRCDVAQAILRHISRWWDLDCQSWSSFAEWGLWFSSLRFPANSKSLLEGVFCIVWWSIWVFRNRLLFEVKPPSRSMLIDDIVSLSFFWCSNRCKGAFSWEN
nr:RNA-directed DNA polymerase, eukaryota [Tanacetum cinerariifolium]